MKNFLKNISQYLALAAFAICLTILFLGMRAVMGVGGFCAEGGPYQITVHCPQGVAGMVPLSIFGMLISGAIYIFTRRENTPNIAILFWTALFGSLGWNFLEFAFFPPDGSGLEIGWLICGIMFEIMAIGPLFFIGKEEALNLVPSSSMLRKLKMAGVPVKPVTVANPSSGQKAAYLLICLVAAAAGIWFGLQIFNYFSAPA